MTPAARPIHALTFLAAAIAASGLAPAPTRPARAAEPLPPEAELLSAARILLGEVADHSVRHIVRDNLWEDADAGRYGLKPDDNWEAVASASPEAPLVVVIHGLNSTAASNAAILVPIRAAGLPAATFAYPNDADLNDSAEFLSKTLKAFAADHPRTSIALVTHSMGGLVARACVEDPALDPGNIARLVMIAPPTHGSLIAQISIGADLWEHGIARPEGDFWTRLHDSVVDGLDEASGDLVPGSPFLTRLNARARNPRVRYAIFLGTRTPVSDGAWTTLRWALARAGRNEQLGALATSVDKVLADMDELVDGKGDGVVAVKRGRLAGVDDVLELPFDHLSATGEPGDDAAVHRVQAELVARLR